MLKKSLSLLLLYLCSILTFAQVNVSLRLDKLKANSWLEFANPSINTIKVHYIFVRVFNKSNDPLKPDVPVDNGGYYIGGAESCNLHISPANQDIRGNFQNPQFHYARNFAIPQLLNSDYYAIIDIRMTGYQKKGTRDLCDCNDKLQWDGSINCIKLPFVGRVCLGGFVGPFDKYCDQDYSVTIRIDKNSTPYVVNTTGEVLSSANDRYGAMFNYSFTAPPSKQLEIVGESLAGSSLPNTGDDKIKRETVCSQDNFSLTAKGGFQGITSYNWYRNGIYFTNTPISESGGREATLQLSRTNNTPNEITEIYSTSAVYGGNQSNQGLTLPIYIHPPRPSLIIDDIKFMTCHDSYDNYIDLSASGVIGIDSFRFSMRKISDRSIFNDNGINVRFSGDPDAIPLFSGNDNAPLYEQYQVIAENIMTNPSSLGIGKTAYTCSSPIDTFSMRNPKLFEINELDVIEYNGAQIQCKDSTNGRIDVNASGGTVPYAYSYNNLTNIQNDKRFNALKPDTLYTFHVRDNNGCITNESITLSEPDYVQTTRTASVYSDFYNINCKGGSDGFILFNNATGGVAPYRYSINSGNSYQTATTFSGLRGNFYNLKVLDVNNCIFKDTITLHEPELLTIDTVRSIQPACFGFNDGLIELKSDGGVKHKPYTFSIDNYFLPHTKTPASPASYNDSVSFTGLQTFNYIFKVVDGNNCEATVPVSLNQPDSIHIEFDTKDITCNGDTDGDLNTIVTGGTKPYYYTWSGGGLSIFNSPTQSSVNNLRSDTYRLQITDGHNCNSVKQQVILEPRPLFASVNKVVNVSCYDGSDASIEILSGGGYAPHSYSLNNSPFIASRNIFDTLSAGKYIVRVRDAGGCEITLPEVEISKPNALSARATVQNVSCSYSKNGMISMDAYGGNGGYTFAYNYDGSFTRFNTFYNLEPGWHVIRVKDTKNCILDKDVYVGSPDELKLTLETVSLSDCGETTGSAIVNATGGTNPYTYYWMNQQAQGNSVVNLPMGVHPIVVMDAKQCKDTLLVGISDVTGPIVDVLNTIAPACYDSDNGSITVAVQGGNTGYTFNWFDPAQQTGPTASNLSEENYLVKVTDATNCGTVKTIFLDAPEKQELFVDQVIPSLCHSDCEGSISVFGYGGTEPYSFVWDNAQAGGIANDLCEGMYSVALADANGCKDTQSIALINPSPIAINIPDTLKLCTNQVKKLDAGNQGSDFLWTSSNGFSSTNQVVNISQSGNYTLTVTNENNCIATKTFLIQIVPNLLVANFLVKGKNTTEDTLAFVDVSNPKPEKIEWKFTDNALVIDKNGPYAFVKYPAPGKYVVKLSAYLGSCIDEVEKEITIYDPADFPSNQRNAFNKRNGILNFTIYPNPNEGDFTAEVLLDTIQTVSIAVYDMMGNKISSIEKSENAFYKEQLNLLPYQPKPGIYLVRVETVSDRRTIVFTIH